MFNAFAALSMKDIIFGSDKNRNNVFGELTMAAGGASRIATFIFELKNSGSSEPPAMI
jgi:hypothetical protein